MVIFLLVNFIWLLVECLFVSGISLFIGKLCLVRIDSRVLFIVLVVLIIVIL